MIIHEGCSQLWPLPVRLVKAYVENLMINCIMTKLSYRNGCLVDIDAASRPTYTHLRRRALLIKQPLC